MDLKKAIILTMDRDDLKTVIDAHEVETVDRRSRSSMARSVGIRKEFKPSALLAVLSEQQVKQVCELLEVSSVGRKNKLIEALLNRFGDGQKNKPAQPRTGSRGKKDSGGGAKSSTPQKQTRSRVRGKSKPVQKSMFWKEPEPLSFDLPAAPAKRAVEGRTRRKLTRKDVPAPGMRIVVRDAEWLVRRVDTTATGGRAISAVGISELVRDKEAVFLTELEPSIEILKPEETRIVTDPSPHYRSALLYLESQLRQTPPTDENLYIGHRAAMDALDFQLDPAIQALEQPRQRLLIADAVGLGKTLECGILLSELIQRGKAKRILVLAIKSMLTQFQKEMWSRFAIPLTRLDSVGIQRIRRNLPTNHNPFYYFDKSIISIDTLKQDREYRNFLEKAYWDVIVIDEAQNVAERGKKISLRSRLADLLASRSDTLIMLSATPHDGRASSFASLMNMLDPTAIAAPENYTRDDIQGLFIRRFKKDIQHMVTKNFPARRIREDHCKASAAEEAAFDAFASSTFNRLGKRRGGGQLFKTVLEKALLSSPAACLETIEHRLDSLEKKENPADWTADKQVLESLRADVKSIHKRDFSKYHKLLEVIRDPDQGFGWTGEQADDRLVVFTERIATMAFVADNLKKDLGLKDKQVVTLDGSLKDTDQQAIVESFGKLKEPVRLLVASDVASEGINLHYLCHKMVHFDIPWSLMVFKQRNGRIDRYGQERVPRIAYLITDSANKKFKADNRILAKLIEKDQQAQENIGDPSTFMAVFDQDEEEQITAEAIEAGMDAEDFGQQLEGSKFDPLADLLGEAPVPAGEQAAVRIRPVHSLFADDYTYLKAALDQINQSDRVQVEFDDANQRVELTAPEDLQHRFRFLPREVQPDDWCFSLCADKDTIQEEIKACRNEQEESAWPRLHFLWALNPVVTWANDRVLSAFGRHEAPLVTLPDGVLEPGEEIFVLAGLIPNRKSHPLVQRWFSVVLKKGRFDRIEDFAQTCARTDLGKADIPNLGDQQDDAVALEKQLGLVVDKAKAYMAEQRKAFDAVNDAKLQEQLDRLEALRARHQQQLELIPNLKPTHKQMRERKVKDLFDDFIDWVEDTMTTEKDAYIQIAAVLRGAS